MPVNLDIVGRYCLIVLLYIYKIDIPEEFIEKKEFIEKDQKRDRAFKILISIKIELNFRYPTYQTPYKLRKFKI